MPKKQNGAISPHKGALLQTFPRRYSFVPDCEDGHITRMSRMIRSAEPVKLGAAIGNCIKKHVMEHNER